MTDTDTDSPAADPARYRLPDDLRPLRYELVIEPELADGTFAGTVEVLLECVRPTDRVVCNALGLDIVSADLHDATGPIAVVEVGLDPDTERVAFGLARPIATGSATIRIGFTGNLDERLRGFYRSTFTDADGIERSLATTQFEATDARRAFPCWDEPALKATFVVSLVVDADHQAVANAAEVSRTPVEGRPHRHLVRFAETVPMSTYLVAFVVGPLEITPPIDVDGVDVRVVHTPGKGHLTDHALETAEFCLRYFSDYYGIAYPGDKLDLVAVPDFAFGAMENLGCVIFREVLLLVDPATTTQAELQNVTDVIAHELAHMWFGDLVTMKWWNGIWLNEAFATFMEMMATDAFRPEWDRWTSFGLARTAAFDTDALRSSRPIEYPVVSPADAEGMFDILTYEKGAAVVRMLEQYLGPDEFRAGIRHYLSTHEFGCTETTDLWDAIETATGEPVRRIMDSWIFQAGFPAISVDLVDDGGTLRIGQHRFGYAGSPGNAPTPADDTVTAWSIPVIFTQRSATDGVIGLEKVLLETDTMDITLLEPTEWIMGNTEGVGFHRVRYAPELRAALVAHAQRDLSPIERYGLVDDDWAWVLAGVHEAHDFLALVEAFVDESDLSVWQRIVAGLGELDRLVDGEAREVLHTRARALLTPAYERLGDDPVAGESDRASALRGVLLQALGVVGDDADLQARSRALLLIDDLHPDPSLVAAAAVVVAHCGTESDFDDFVGRMRAATTPQESIRWLGALADFRDPTAMRRLLDMSLTDAVRTQDAPLLLRRALSNRDLGPMVWSFVAENWETINQRLPSNSIARMLAGVRTLGDPVTAAAVKGFFTDHAVPQGERILAQHLEHLDVTMALRARETHRFAHHLRREH
ncbi:MAG: M1 family metallopeptidase [Acidimicrobiia bacterium]|nr:M1 family metallopeptidase [Acidimicrobiia bacterium]